MAIKGKVYYCPELRLYRTQVTSDAAKDDVAYFDGDELEDLLVAQLASSEGDETQARFLAQITGLARVNPHKIVAFSTVEGKQELKIEIIEAPDYWKKHDEARDAAEAGSGK